MTMIDPEYHANCERRARLAEGELVGLRARLAAVEAALGDFPVDLRPIDPADVPLVDEMTWRLREAHRAVAGAREALGRTGAGGADG
jgi:hypothetical protein